jgi:hypothetical protein
MNCCHLSLYGIPELKTETVHLGVPCMVLREFLGTLCRVGGGACVFTASNTAKTSALFPSIHPNLAILTITVPRGRSRAVVRHFV